MSREYHEIYKITWITDEAKDVKTFMFHNASDNSKQLKPKPGNFLMAWLPGVSENPFSISYNYPLGITVKKLGDFTSRLFELHVNDNLWIRGPYGNSFKNFSKKCKKYLIAGGSGAIPLAFLSENLSENSTVLLGAKTKNEIMFEERFRKSNNDIFISTEDGSYGFKGIVTDLFDKIDIKQNSQFYVCGPERMMIATAEKAIKYTEPENIILSLENYMKCGRGLCGSCETNGYRTCVDGPIFTYKQLIEEGSNIYLRTKSGVKNV